MKRVVNVGGRRIEYTLIQSTRKNVLFQALPEAGIRVYAPKYLRLRDVDAMVRDRAEQLTHMQREVEQRLEERREQLSARLEPSGAIKSQLIQEQGQLLALLYDEQTASDEMRALKRSIDADRQRLESRRL